jgi:hypothetical protein
MPLERLVGEPPPTKTKLLILCCKRSEFQVRTLLAAYTHVNWESEGLIRVVARNDNLARFRAENSFLINKYAPKRNGARVVLLDDIDHEEMFGKGNDSRSVNIVSNSRSLERVLPAILLQSGLDAMTVLMSQLRTYIHGVVNLQSIEQWLSQFEQLGVPYIGDYLLRTLDYWTPDRLRAACGIDAKYVQQFQWVCLKRQEVGKSGDFLSNLLRKQVTRLHPGCRMQDFVGLLNSINGANAGKILFVEDGLFTGTEMTNFFSGLLGLELPKGRVPWSIGKLVNPATLTGCDIELLFPVSTSLGQQRLEIFLQKNNLKRIHINCCEIGQIEVLTNSGQAALNEGAFYDPAISNCPSNHGEHIEKVAFRGPWKSDAFRAQTKAFCDEVGRQLFSAYLKRKGFEWPEKKVTTSSLGMHGLGLNVAFAHSVPKASLPLLWAEGEVRFGGSKIQWVPLFPSAEV